MRAATPVLGAILAASVLLLSSALAQDLRSVPGGPTPRVFLPPTKPAAGTTVSTMSSEKRNPRYEAAGLTVTGNFMPWVCQFCTWSGSESAFATEYAPYAANMTELSTEMYYLSSSCTDWLCSQGYENTSNDLTPFDHAHGIRPLPMITTCTISTLQSFLGTESDWAGFISAAVAKAVYLGYGGYNIDWEPDTSCASGTTTPENGFELAHFVDQFANASHAHGLIVTLDYAYWDTNFWNEAALAATTGDVFMEMNYQCPGAGFTDDLDADLSYFPPAHLGEALDPEEGCSDAQMVEEISEVQAAGVSNIEWWALDDGAAALDNAHLWTAVHDFVYDGAFNGTTSQAYDPGSWGLNSNEHPSATGGEINLFTLGTDEQGYETSEVAGTAKITSVNLTLRASLDSSDYRIYEGNLSANGTVLSSWQLPVTNATLVLGAPPGSTPTTSLMFELATDPGGTLGAYLSGGNGTYAYFGVVINPPRHVTPPAITSFTATPPKVSVGGQTQFAVSVSGGATPYTYLYTGLPLGCSSSNASLLDCTPTTAGNYPVMVNVSDPLHQYTSSTTTLTVQSVVPALSITTFEALPDPLALGTETNLSVTLSGGSGPFTYTFTGLPPGCSSANRSVLPCTPSKLGEFNVTVLATDPVGQHASDLTPVHVVQGGSPLVVSSLLFSPDPVTLGHSTTLQVLLSGGIAPFSFTYTGLPPGCASVNFSSFACEPTANGTFSVTVQVSDARGDSVTNATTLIVSPPAPSGTTGGGSPFTGTDLMLLLVLIVAIVAVLAALFSRKRKPDEIPPSDGGTTG